MVIANLPGKFWCLQNLQGMVLSPSTFLKDLVPCEGMRRGTGQGEVSAEGSSETWWDLVSQLCLEAQCSQNSARGRSPKSLDNRPSLHFPGGLGGGPLMPGARQGADPRASEVELGVGGCALR